MFTMRDEQRSARRDADRVGARASRWVASGQALAEFALTLALVAVIAIAATLYLGAQTSGVLSTIGDGMNGISGAPATTPPSGYTKKKTCKQAGYKWVTKPKPAHCT